MNLPLTPGRKADMLQALERATEALAAMPTVRPCGACDHFDKGRCGKWGADVPSAAQELGCDEFVDAVPF